jgi:putative ABC transport system permease protein
MEAHFMSPLDLAARNIRRNARRSLLTLAALAVGTMAVLLFSGYVTDTIQGLQTATVRSTGHFQIMTKGYLEFGRGNPGRFAIRNYPAIIAEIRRDPALASMLTMVTPVLDVEGVSSNYDTEASTSFVDRRGKRTPVAG